MNPIKFWTVPRANVAELTARNPIPQGLLNDYERLRPGILNDRSVDIFCRNSRSERQRWTVFELFEQVDTPGRDVVIVLQSWLELFEAGGCHENIGMMLGWLDRKFPENPIVVSWNHDRDSADVPELRSLPANFLVVNFNTSRKSANDVVVPFWTIETRIDWEPPGTKRMLRGSFIGNGGGNLRKSMIAAFSKASDHRDGWVVHDAKVPHDEYIGVLACSEFALCPRGGGLNSYRLYEAIQCGAIPVLFADDAILPYDDLAWNQFIIRIPERYAGNFSYVNDLLDQANVSKMRENLAGVRERMSLAGVQREIYKRLKAMEAK